MVMQAMESGCNTYEASLSCQAFITCYKVVGMLGTPAIHHSGARYHVHARSLQLCPTLCNPMDCSPGGSSVPGISQAKILEWVAMPSSRGYFQPGIKPASPVAPDFRRGGAGGSLLSHQGDPGARLVYLSYWKEVNVILASCACYNILRKSVLTADWKERKRMLLMLLQMNIFKHSFKFYRLHAIG